MLTFGRRIRPEIIYPDLNCRERIAALIVAGPELLCLEVARDSRCRVGPTAPEASGCGALTGVGDEGGLLGLGLKRQGQERGDGHEEPGRQAARREAPAAQTPRPPRVGARARGLIASDINTRVTLFAWLHTQRPLRA